MRSKIYTAATYIATVELQTSSIRPPKLSILGINRVLGQNLVHKRIGFNYPNFQLSEHTQGPMSLDKQGSTVYLR